MKNCAYITTTGLASFSQAIVHVSTAYANCNRTDIEEKFYKPPLSGENALKMADALDDKTLDKMTPE